MSTTLVRSLANAWFDRLNWIDSSVRECPDELWEASMFPVAWPSEWEKGKDFEAHHARFQVFSTPWLVAYHAVFHALWADTGSPADDGHDCPAPSSARHRMAKQPRRHPPAAAQSLLSKVYR